MLFLTVTSTAMNSDAAMKTVRITNNDGNSGTVGVGEGDEEDDVTVNVIAAVVPVVTSSTSRLYVPAATLGTVTVTSKSPFAFAVPVPSLDTTFPFKVATTEPFGVNPEPVACTLVPAGPLVGLIVTVGAAFTLEIVVKPTVSRLRSTRRVTMFNVFFKR